MPLQPHATIRPLHQQPDSVERPLPFQATTCREQEAPTSAREMSMSRHTRVGYIDGREPQPRAVLPGYDTGVMAVVIGIFMLLALSMRHFTNFAKSFTQNLLTVRRRDNAFDEHTVGESGIMGGLALLACVGMGIMLYFAAGAYGFGLGLGPFPAIALMTGAAIVLILCQSAAYATTGYAFTDFRSTSLWLKGFFASQALLGLALTIPALWLLFNPGAASVMLPIGAALYVLARIVFICKGFKIFYANFFSVIYFILYLCTLEIVPLVVLYRVVINASAYI